MKFPVPKTRVIELIVIFVFAPIVMWMEIVPISKLLILLIGFAYCCAQLHFDKSFELKAHWKWRINWPRFIVKCLIVAFALTLICLFLTPKSLFSFPMRKPHFWLIVMLLYPFLSAFPQELIYRTFFFHRYKILLKNEKTALFANAILFSFLHIIYDNTPALIITFLGGLIFARTYEKSKSLPLVTLEHALYGCWLFTIGLGGFFYEGR